ncbi:MAG: flavodoxin family protein [Oscillospiraceae bacterium]|jgi:hypothetical protein|nr:flavodoxin family protein [Oscillospiraceae bacterium]
MNKVIYVSRGGHTKKLAEAVARGASCTAEALTGATQVTGADTLFVGGAIYAGSLDGKLTSFLRSLTPESARRVAVFGSCASPNASILELVRKEVPGGIEVSSEAYQCLGSFLVIVSAGHPNAADLSGAEQFGKRQAAL